MRLLHWGKKLCFDDGGSRCPTFEQDGGHLAPPLSNFEYLIATSCLEFDILVSSSTQYMPT
jgi:hypothetical protein